MTLPTDTPSTANELPEQPYKAAEGMAADRANQAAALANMHRLRAERLIREAANPPKAKPTRKKNPPV